MDLPNLEHISFSCQGYIQFALSFWIFFLFCLNHIHEPQIILLNNHITIVILGVLFSYYPFIEEKIPVIMLFLVVIVSSLLLIIYVLNSIFDSTQGDIRFILNFDFVGKNIIFHHFNSSGMDFFPLQHQQFSTFIDGKVL